MSSISRQTKVYFSFEEETAHDCCKMAEWWTLSEMGGRGMPELRGVCVCVCLCLLVFKYQSSVWGMNCMCPIQHWKVGSELRFQELSRHVCLIWDDFSNSAWNNLSLELPIIEGVSSITWHSCHKDVVEEHPLADGIFNPCDPKFHFVLSLWNNSTSQSSTWRG